MTAQLTTLIKGLVLLETLAASPQPRGVSELARELGLQKSNVFRILKTLSSCGYIRQQALSGRYECTLKIWELGVRIRERLDVVAVARVHLTSLAELSGETIHLSILDGADVIYLDKIDSLQPVRAYSQVGGRAPAYCVATGKAMLAFTESSLLADLTGKLASFTSRTLTSRVALARELDKIRETGFAVNRGEWRSSVGGIAAPIFDGTGAAVAAIGVSGPVERLGPARLRVLAPWVMTAAQQVSLELGYRPTVTSISQVRPGVQSAGHKGNLPAPRRSPASNAQARRSGA